MAQIVILEGLPRTGKSTVGRALARAGHVSFQPEIYETLPPGLKRWTQTGPDEEVSAWFLEQNIRLLEDASRRPEALRAIDRSYLSTLAFCHARLRLTGAGEVEQKLEAVRRRVLDVPAIRVVRVLFFDDPPEASFERIYQTWHSHVSLWNRLDFLRAARDYSQWFLENVEVAPVTRVQGTTLKEKVGLATEALRDLLEP